MALSASSASVEHTEKSQFLRNAETLAEKAEALARGVQQEEAKKDVTTANLVMLVKRLGYSLKCANPDSKLPGEAMDLLKKYGLIGVEDILR